jgi:glucose-6-phosphate dehydrogenase assembly protein OpcA
MASTYKVLGQSNPAATTATTLYTVPSAKSAVVSTIAVCNQGGSSATFRIAVRPAGASLAAQHYIAYDSTVTANNTTMITIGVTLATTDVVTVYASNTSLSFSAFGTEIG